MFKINDYIIIIICIYIFTECSENFSILQLETVLSSRHKDIIM